MQVSGFLKLSLLSIHYSSDPGKSSESHYFNIRREIKKLEILPHNLCVSESLRRTRPQSVFLAEHNRVAVMLTFDLCGKYHSAAN